MRPLTLTRGASRLQVEEAQSNGSWCHLDESIHKGGMAGIRSRMNEE